MKSSHSSKISAFLYLTVAHLLFFPKANLIAQQEVVVDLREQARSYRDEGLNLQNDGSIEEAIAYYQKAIFLDPNYAVAYNDLGIVFEMKGWRERAEAMYLNAIDIDPDYPNSYSNLALLYENNEDYPDALLYWLERAFLGTPQDYWAEEAKEHIKDIALAYPEAYDEIESKYKENLQQLNLSREDIFFGQGQDSAAQEEAVQSETPPAEAPQKEVAQAKSAQVENEALDYLQRAKDSFSRREYVSALRDATLAEYLDASNEEIRIFIEKVRKALLE